MHQPKFVPLILSILLVFSIAAIGAVGSASAPQIYAQLNQPSWSPPAYLFGPVWTVLYLMIAVSFWLIAIQPHSDNRSVALRVFTVQLVLNGLWSWTFFAWQQGALALVNIILLWLFIVWTMKLNKPLNKWASYLLAPYLAWVTFATVLNWAMWHLNPEML